MSAPAGADDVVRAEDGEFDLLRGGRGNPGCDRCGFSDATIRKDGEYQCEGCSDVVEHKLVLTIPMREGRITADADLEALGQLIRAVLVQDARIAGDVTVTKTPSA